MEAKINALREQMEAALAAVQVQEDLAAFWQSYLGKKGSIAGLMKELGAVAKEDRPAMGKVINQFKTYAEERYQQVREEMDRRELAARNQSEQVDITMPAVKRPVGALHPITIVKDQMVDVFAGMGFEIYEGPEIEDDDHNFTRLNVAKNHPARDMQDTFYVAEDIVLRTHTSPGQIRVMDSQQPPIKVLVPGRVFRSDSDATHSPMFHQIEGLVVDKGVTMADLKGTLNAVIREIYGPNTKTRFRPHHFPFTEPSCEMDVQCHKCGGVGCPTCKGEDIVLRTHTSPGQIRVMDSQQPPIKVLVPGRVFRSDSDATHSPMFHQMEGLVVDKKITLCDLQGMLDQFVKKIFGDEVKTRLRPSYFPFTEPSVEVDVSCFECGGKGCGLCKGTGWIEVLGGGIVHHKVLENCGIDPNEYSGLAFGIGIERIAMLKYGINNIGLLYENDLRFLKQFKD